MREECFFPFSPHLALHCLVQVHTNMKLTDLFWEIANDLKREPGMAFLSTFWEALWYDLLHLVMLHAKKININTNRTMFESDWISFRIQSLSFWTPSGLTLLSIWYIFSRKLLPAKLCVASYRYSGRSIVFWIVFIGHWSHQPRLLGFHEVFLRERVLLWIVQVDQGSQKKVIAWLVVVLGFKIGGRISFCYSK